jgi:catechol-2,3-dioxygenase
MTRMHIGHVALRVPDLEASARHARESLGLHETSRSDAEIRLSANAKAHELQLIAAEAASLDHVGLEVEDQGDLDAVRDRLSARGVAVVDADGEDLGAAIRFAGPGGIAYEVYAGMAREPLSVANLVTPLARKLGHLTFFSDEIDEIIAFWVEVLGFRVSDDVGRDGAWLRCDPDHHGLAVGRSSAPGTRLHHYAFELQGWETVGAYADHLARRGERLLWGPGRHGPGRNIFTYVKDPAGCVVEAYTDLLRIDDEAAYQAIDWSTVPSNMNLWGPDMPDDWDQHGIPVLAASAGPSA